MRKIINDIEENDLTVQAAFDNFITLKRSEGRRDATIRSYKVSFKNFQQYCIDNKIINVKQINKQLIENYKEYLVDLDISAESKNTYLRAVKAYTNYLIDNGSIAFFKIKLFSSPSKEHVSTFSDEELKKLLNSPLKKSKNFSDVRDYYMMLTLFLTGIRRSTLVNMMIDDVDFDNEKICLRHIKRDNEFKIKEIPLNSDLKSALQKYLRITRLREQKIKYLFPNVEGNMLHPDTVSKHINRICESVGIPIRGCHEFRRTFATKCYDQLDDIEKTRKLMLISDPRVLKHYVNEDIGILQKSSEQLNFATQIQSPFILKHSIEKK